MGLDRQRHRLAGARQFLQGARRAMHQIAEAVDVEEDGVLAVGIDDAFELADHARVLPNLPLKGGGSERSEQVGVRDREACASVAAADPHPTIPLSGGGKMKMMSSSVIAQQPLAQQLLPPPPP